jgi:hypothetical protein
MSAPTTPPLPLAEVTRRAIEILSRELGPADAARFVNQFSVGSGDYTAERAGLFGHLTLAEIVGEIRGQLKPNEPLSDRTQGGDAGK